MCSRTDIVEMARRLFEDYDADESGFLSREEVKVVVETVLNEVSKVKDISERQRNKLFTMCDENSDNKLSRKEFSKMIELYLEPVLWLYPQIDICSLSYR